MITRQTKLQLLAFFLISVVGLTYTGMKYAGLGKYFTDEGFVVSADFADSGGIFEGAEVTYRGVPAGSVEKLTVVEDGVRVAMRLRPGTKVPDDAAAEVGNRSAVGEQYVDLVPERADGPFLEPGDVIPQERTSTPIQPAELITNLDEFVKSVDLADIGVVLDELGRAFDDAGGSLQRLVDAGDALTRAATEALPETKRLIEDGNVVLETQRDTAQQFRSFNRDLNLLAQQLRASDPDFRRLFDNGTRAAVEIDDLLTDTRTDLPVLLSNLVTVAQVQKVRIPAIKQILVTYPNTIAGGFTVIPGDGTTHFGLVEQSDPPPCERGYESTRERPPQDTTKKQPNMRAHCALRSQSGINVRGTQNAPRPPGTPPFPGDERTNGTPSTGRDPEGGSRSTGDPVALGDYDPLTGRVITEDGQRFTLGSTSGAQKLFGGDSWQWLLLGPLSQ